MPTKSSPYLLVVVRYWHIFTTFFFITNHSFGQGIGRSPYSALGVGEKFSGAFAANQAMGDAGVSVGNGIYVNNLNPALVAFNRFTAFEIGAIAQRKIMQEGATKQKDFGANLNYVAMAFPSGKKWSMAVQLKPYSYVDYEARSTRLVENTLNFANYTYKGTGGLNKVALTNATLLGKSLYVGLEAAYVFGGIDRESLTQLQLADGQDYTIQLLERTNHGGFVFKPGVALRHKLKEKLFLGVGATAEFSSSIRANRLQTYDYLIGDRRLGISPIDTVSKDVRSNLTLPGSYRAGISLDKPLKFSVSADIAYHPWSQYRNFSGRSESNFQDSYSVHLGGEFTPDFDAVGKLLKRTQYRIGYQFIKLPYTTPTGASISDHSVTLGFALPLWNLSYINFGVAAGQRTGGPIKEQYGKVMVGFTLSDNWFRKTRLN